MLKDLILKNRSYRRFDQAERLPMELLRAMVDAARLSPSGRNGQSLRYMLFNSEKDCAGIFPHLAWAGYIPEWKGPEEGERPVAYIFQLAEKDTASWCDDGIAIQSMMLTAVEQGYGGCILGSVQRAILEEKFSIPEKYRITYVLALGRPVEKVVIEDIAPGDRSDEAIRYWRDRDLVHHVPKRRLNDLILE